MREIIIDDAPVQIMSIAEAADTLGITESAVRSQTTKSHKEKLRRVPKELIPSDWPDNQYVFANSVYDHLLRRRRYMHESSIPGPLSEEEKQKYPDPMSIAKAAQYLGVSYRTVYRKANQGYIRYELHAMKDGRDQMYLYQYDLDKVRKFGWEDGEENEEGKEGNINDNKGD